MAVGGEWGKRGKKRVSGGEKGVDLVFFLVSGCLFVCLVVCLVVWLFGCLFVCLFGWLFVCGASLSGTGKDQCAKFLVVQFKKERVQTVLHPRNVGVERTTGTH